MLATAKNYVILYERISISINLETKKLSTFRESLCTILHALRYYCRFDSRSEYIKHNVIKYSRRHGARYFMWAFSRASAYLVIHIRGAPAPMRVRFCNTSTRVLLYDYQHYFSETRVPTAIVSI